MVGHDAAEPAGGDRAPAIEDRAALQEDHPAVHEFRSAAIGDVGHERTPGTIDMIGQAFACDRDVFRTAGGAAGLAQVERLPGPEHIGLALYHAFQVGLQLLVIAQWHGIDQAGVSGHVLQAVFPAENGVPSRSEQALEHFALRAHRIERTAHHRRGDHAGQRFCDRSLQAHCRSGPRIIRTPYKLVGPPGSPATIARSAGAARW